MKVNILRYQLDETELSSWALEEGRNHEEDWVRDYANSILEWFDDDDFIVINTSGSTGAPKSIQLTKDQMRQSALKTAQRFNLAEGMHSLHCLPSKYIAGKMMLIRALVLGMNQTCIKPKLALQFGKDRQFDFAAMTPMQLSVSMELKQNDVNCIQILLLGGGPMNAQLFHRIGNCKTSIYVTYGMTETITHVAVAPANGRNRTDIYKALEGVNFSQNEGNLVIDADHLSERIWTNDQVELIDSRHFRWLGRKDNVINSGGVKIRPEQIEKKLSPHLSDRFIIVGRPDSFSGEKVVLVIESSVYDDHRLELLDRRLSQLDKLSQPRDIIFISQFQETPTGKIVRDGPYFD